MTQAQLAGQTLIKINFTIEDDTPLLPSKVILKIIETGNVYEITSEETAHQLGLRGGTNVFGALWKTEDNTLQVTASTSTNAQVINDVFKIELLEILANGKSYTNFIY